MGLNKQSLLDAVQKIKDGQSIKDVAADLGVTEDNLHKVIDKVKDGGEDAFHDIKKTLSGAWDNVEDEGKEFFEKAKGLFK